MRSKWLCPKCRATNQRTSSSKCLTCGGLTKPKRKVPKHAVALRDLSFDHFREVNEQIHGQGSNCGVCGTPPKDDRNLQREHDHVTGLPRGLACWRCNRLMPKQFDLAHARLIVAYLERVEAHYGGPDVSAERAMAQRAREAYRE